MSVCKICLCSDPDKYLSQTSENLEQSGEYVLLFCLGIQVIQGPEGSVKLCGRCFTKLTEFYQFKSQALRNEAILSGLGLEKYIERDIKKEVPSQDNDDNSFDEPLIACSELQDPKPEQLLVEIDTKHGSSAVVVLDNKPALQRQDLKVKLLDKKPLKRKKLKDISKEETKSILESSEVGLYPCDLCERRFKSKCALAGHLQKHNPNKCECAHCGKMFMSKVQLVKHIMCYHPEEVSQNMDKYKIVWCQLCPLKFSTKSALKQHLKNDHGDDIQCPICNKQSSASYLDQHIRDAHEPEALLYKCDHCDKRFSRPSVLKNHASVHSDVKPFPCDICGVKFRLKYSVTLHKAQVHEKSKNHMCHICSKSFFTNSLLRAHMRKHIEKQKVKKGEPVENSLKKPCPDCGKPIVSRGKAMQRHRSLHQGQQHACKLCGLTFATRRYVTCHMKTHFQERKYACRFCDAKFVRCSGKCRHEREVHIAAGEKKPPRKDTRKNRPRKKKIKKVEEDYVPNVPTVTVGVPGASQDPTWPLFPITDPFKTEIDVIHSE